MVVLYLFRVDEKAFCWLLYHIILSPLEKFKYFEEIFTLIFLFDNFTAVKLFSAEEFNYA